MNLTDFLLALETDMAVYCILIEDIVGDFIDEQIERQKQGATEKEISEAYLNFKFELPSTLKIVMPSLTAFQVDYTCQVILDCCVDDSKLDSVFASLVKANRIKYNLKKTFTEKNGLFIRGYQLN